MRPCWRYAYIPSPMSIDGGNAEQIFKTYFEDSLSLFEWTHTAYAVDPVNRLLLLWGTESTQQKVKTLGLTRLVHKSLEVLVLYKKVGLRVIDFEIRAFQHQTAPSWIHSC